MSSPFVELLSLVLFTKKEDELDFLWFFLILGTKTLKQPIKREFCATKSHTDSQERQGMKKTTKWRWPSSSLFPLLLHAFLFLFSSHLTNCEQQDKTRTSWCFRGKMMGMECDGKNKKTGDRKRHSEEWLKTHRSVEEDASSWSVHLDSQWSMSFTVYPSLSLYRPFLSRCFL